MNWLHFLPFQVTRLYPWAITVDRLLVPAQAAIWLPPDSSSSWSSRHNGPEPHSDDHHHAEDELELTFDFRTQTNALSMIYFFASNFFLFPPVLLFSKSYCLGRSKKIFLTWFRVKTPLMMCPWYSSHTD